jgi:2-methylcitrate dehydratase PrpD
MTSNDFDMSVAETRKLVDWAVRLKFSDIPQPTVEKTKRLFADWVFCAFAGAGYRTIDGLKAVADETGGAAQGPCSTFVGDKRPPYWASYINAGAGHVVEQDDLHNASVVHPATVVFPAAWAAAQSRGASGADFIAASVIGYEVACRVGRLLGREHYRIFHSTATAGTLGAAAATARILGLDAEKTLDALGSAGTQAAGLWQFLATAADSKQVHCAHAAGTGVQSAFLAKHGVTGAHDILLGPQGMFAGMSKGKPDASVLPFDGQYEVDATSFKFHSSCRHTHPSADALLDIITENGLAPEDIARVDCGVHQSALDVLGPAEGAASVHQSKFSMGFVLGAIANGRSAQLADFTEARLEDQAVRNFQKKVHMYLDPKVDGAYPAKWTAQVKVTTTDGRTFEKFMETPKGDPGNTLSDEELLAKWHKLIGYAGSSVDVDSLAKELLALEKRPSMDGLI